MSRDCSNFLKGANKQTSYISSRKFHGAKKTLLRFLHKKYSLIECKRLLQINYNLPHPSPHYLLLLTFNVIGNKITFRTPLEGVWSENFKLTDNRIRIFFGLIPADSPSSFNDIGQVQMLTNILNSIPNLHSKDDERKEKSLKRFEEFITSTASEKIITQLLNV